jgi:uncharacterized SAM-binding protein YcdF (DUF218 family)
MMFFLKKLITHLILPPGLLVIAFALLGILTKRKLAKLLAFSFALFVYLLSIEPIKDVLYKPLEEAYPVPSKPEGDAIVILGGGAYNTGILKEDSTKRLLTGFVLKIHTDVNSKDTKENAQEVKKLCERLRCKKIILVTSAYHMKRAVLSFQKAGLEVVPYPTDFKRDMRYNLYSLLPKMGVFADSYKALREYLGLVWYSF